MNPAAVLISDIHYSLKTLPLADAAMRMAIAKANELNVSLIVAGDLHDTKANMRAECVSAMLATFRTCNKRPVVMVGNHDKVNERSEDHSLEFLSKDALLVDSWDCWKNLHFVPYYSNVEELRKRIAYEEPNMGDIVIMHQGLQGSDSGEYYQDLTALNYEDVAHLRVISGHYHRRQTIDTGKGNKFDYIGNPYMLGFGEANHPEKGFQILMDDGSLEFVPTNLRKHVIIEREMTQWGSVIWEKPNAIGKEDLIWVKVTGGEFLKNVDKDKIRTWLGLPGDFRLELIPEETKSMREVAISTQTMKQEEILDGLIDSITNTDQDRKARLKEMWKKFAKEG